MLRTRGGDGLVLGLGKQTGVGVEDWGGGYKAELETKCKG